MALQLSQALAHLHTHPNIFLASVEGATPWIRAMSVARVDADGTIWLATWRDSPKVQQVLANPQICLADAEGTMRIFGTARLVDEKTVKLALWHDSWTAYFAGPADPNYVLIAIAPERADSLG
jgi:general stress protein 26